MSYSEQEVGWVGSLAWLQQRNMLYGTELADQDDCRQWEVNRAQAPLDREVDPWGFERLRAHLHRMWWGRDPEEMDQNEETYSGYTARTQEDLNACLAAYPTEEIILYEAPASARQTAPTLSSRRQAGLMGARDASASIAVRSSPSRAAPAAAGRYSTAEAVSLSPRRKAAGYAWGGRGPGSATVSSSVVLPASVYRSPLQTHRALRANAKPDTVPAAGGSTFRRAPPITTIWTTRIE